jgi:hypothetical protein
VKSYILRVNFLIVACFIFTISGNAQLCGDYTTTLNIFSKDENKVGNASIQLIPLGKDETRGKKFVRNKRDSSVFTITFLEGHQLRDEYKLVVSAKGFLPFEKVIKFQHCSEQYFGIYLMKDK